MTEQPLEFVNDWSELEEAVLDLKDLYDLHSDCEPDYCDEAEIVPSLRVITEYVPRLLTQYASLLELSLTLTEGWEQYAKLAPSTGLLVPVH